MRRWLAMLLPVAALAAAVAVNPAGLASSASQEASPAASPATCPVTLPNGNEPPPEKHIFGRGAGNYGNDALWTALWTWGERVILVPEQHVLPDGSWDGFKWPWYRYVPGRLTIEGRRLDGPAPLMRGEVPDGYGDIGFQPSGLYFPTAGCWEITSRVGTSSLTFVAIVVPPLLPAIPAATP